MPLDLETLRAVKEVTRPCLFGEQVAAAIDAGDLDDDDIALAAQVVAEGVAWAAFRRWWVASGLPDANVRTMQVHLEGGCRCTPDAPLRGARG